MQLTASPRALDGHDAAAAAEYGTLGCIADSSSILPDTTSAYDDAAINNRYSNISRSDASVWNSTSAWTAITGRTWDLAVIGGGFRRVLASNGGGMGGGGGGDTSNLLMYNPAYSSVSGLLMTADTGAPGSNTQLLVQMTPAGVFGGGEMPTPAASTTTTAGQSNLRELYEPRPRTALPVTSFPGTCGGAGNSAYGEGSILPMHMVAMKTQVRP